MITSIINNVAAMVVTCIAGNIGTAICVGLMVITVIERLQHLVPQIILVVPSWHWRGHMRLTIDIGDGPYGLTHG